MHKKAASPKRKNQLGITGMDQGLQHGFDIKKKKDLQTLYKIKYAASPTMTSGNNQLAARKSKIALAVDTNG